MAPKKIFLLLALQVLSVLSSIIEPKQQPKDCSISIKTDLTKKPLLLLKSDGNILYGSNNGDITIRHGDVVKVVSPSNKIYIKSTAYDYGQDIKCENGKFEHRGTVVSFVDIRGEGRPYKTIKGRKNKDCSKNVFQIGFHRELKNFFTTMDICYDMSLKIPVYSKFTLSQKINIGQTGGERPKTFDEKFLPGLDALYKRKTQQATINNLLGLPPGDTTYISPLPENTTFLSRGHLTASADFVYIAQRLSTFHHLNVAPQWQEFNEGNWAAIENEVRDFAARKEKDFMVYTGTYGIASLRHAITNQSVELYLDSSRKVPVPLYFWKVLYDDSTNAGIVFLGINNPHIKSSKQDEICPDNCKGSGWLKKIEKYRKDNKKGYVYCCDVNEFNRKAKVLPPSLKVKKVLKY